MSFPLPKAELIGTLLETAGFGAYIIVFIECLRVLYTRHASGRNMRYLIATAVVIFALAAAHLVIDIVRAVDAFTNAMSVPNSAAHFFGTINTPLNLAKSATYIAITLVLDALIVYRVYVVWGRTLPIVLLPGALFLADAALSAWAAWSITEVRPGDDVMLASVTLRVKYFYAVTLALNLFCTLAIAGRIWSVHRGVSAHSISGVRFTGVIAVILESAAIYSVLLVVLIVTSAVASTAMFVVLNAISPIIGMVFSAVIVRASREYHADTYITTRMSFASPPPSSTLAPSSPGASSASPRLSNPFATPFSSAASPSAVSFTNPFSPTESSRRTSTPWRPRKHASSCSSCSRRPSERSLHRSAVPWALPPLAPLDAPLDASPPHTPCDPRGPSRPQSRAASRIQVRVPTPAESVHIRVEMRVSGEREDDIELGEIDGGMCKVGLEDMV